MTLGSDQKMTRHKKRRHDDIHHVGQVRNLQLHADRGELFAESSAV